ncbi:MAG TPA: hypothetical protein VGF24_25370 [Vicinamibacterales bacterium]|jgi:hypothetical protein
MTRTALAFTVAWVYLAASAHAQSAEKIVDRYISAVGGKNALERITSATVTGTVTSADGRSGTFTRETKRPNRLRIRMTWGDGRWSAGFNGRSAWQDDQRDGLRTVRGRAAADVRSEAAYANRAVLSSGETRQLMLVGRDRVRDRQVFVVDAITHDVFKRTFFFDADTYLLLKEQYETESGSEIRFFDDYRRVGQVMEPHRIEWMRGSENVVITVGRVAHNVALDERAFDFPYSPTAPSFDAGAVLSSAMRNRPDLADLRASYAYTQTVTNRELDQIGRIVKEEVTVSEVFYAGGRAVSKLVKRNGQELPDEEKRSEQKRVDGLVREYLQDPTRNVLARGRALSTSYVGSAYLRMLDFTNPRREQVGGTTAVVFDIQAKRDVQPENDFELGLSKSAGTFWIDERAQQVMRTDIHYTAAFKTFWLPGSWNGGEQALVNNEVWLPSSVESQRTAQFGLKFVDKRYYHRMTAQYSDYRKFNVESDYKVTLPEVK